MRHSLALLLCLSVLIMPACAMGDETMLPTPWESFNEGFYNPFLCVANDPWVVNGPDGAYYYCYSLGDMYVVRSETLSGLDAAVSNPACTRRLTVAPGQTELWAPELFFYQGHWYCLYAADYNNDNRLHRMWIMRSKTDDALGEWDEPVKLDLPDDQWAIDGTFFEYPDGRIFTIWSGWKNEAEGTSLWKQYLYIAQLETGDPTRVVSTQRVLVTEPLHGWETSSLPQNEGPTVIVSPEGTYYCMYSGNYSGSNHYTVAAVRLNGDPMDAAAWEKLPEPIMQSDPALGVYSPGHASFVKSPDGTEDWIIYHTAKASGSGWTRNGRAQKLTWVDDTPVVEGNILGNDVLIPLPSGEKVSRRVYQMEDGVLGEGAVIREGVTTSPVVELPSKKTTVTLYVEATEKTSCALYIRHNGAQTPMDVLFVRVNDGVSGKSATISGGEAQFVTECVLFDLEPGMNTLEIRAGKGMLLDLAVLDLAPFGQ